MPPAATILDPTNHPGLITGPGVATVLIGGFCAAVVGDSHACAMPSTGGPHPASFITTGSKNVLIGGRPAARQEDLVGCGAKIVGGSPNVVIGG